MKQDEQVTTLPSFQRELPFQGTWNKEIFTTAARNSFLKFMTALYSWRIRRYGEYWKPKGGIPQRPDVLTVIVYTDKEVSKVM